MILPLIIIIICIFALCMILFWNRQKKQKKGEEVDATVKSAQAFVNVVDIRDIFAYTRDQFLLTYIKVEPISIDLLSKNERRQLAKILTSELSAEQDAFKFLAVSRPVDIAPLVNEYMELLSSTDDLIQKELLRNEIQVVSNYSLSGDVVERQFYYILWEKQSSHTENELKKRTTEFSNKLGNAGLKSKILKQDEIIQLCNLVNNPAYISIEDTDVNSVIPFVR